MQIPGRFQSGVFFLILMLLSGSVPAAMEVGEVSYSLGVLIGQFEGEKAQLKGKGQSIGEGETLSTGDNSYAIIELSDGTRMTLRPNTVFKVDQLNTNAGEENALLSLLKGGFRAITGSISKRPGNSYKITTTVATIGIRGTEFDARICTETDCDEENRSLVTANESSNIIKSGMIARVISLKGNARASSQDGKVRALRVGDPVFEKDRLNTGISTYLVVAFNDRSRMTMTSNSELVIRAHRYLPDKPADNNAVLDFIRGGLRLVSGVIGKLNRDAYRITTPTATIGIRGTGFDLLCRGQCGEGQTGGDSGLYARVWEGAIELKTDNDSLLLDINQTAFMTGAQGKPQLISNIPTALKSMESAPRPDTIPFNANWFSAVGTGDKIGAGLYVNVRDGIVLVQGFNAEELLLTKQESGVVNLAGMASRLESIPPFLRFDQYPQPGPINTRMENMLNLMGAEVENINEFQCVVQ